MKSPLRPFVYMSWAKTVPERAGIDLTASGMLDTVGTGPGAPWDGHLEVADQCRRQGRDRIVDEYTAAVAQRYGVEQTRVVPTLGASMAIMHVLIALVRGGDHVIVERPTYEPLHRVPEILGASVSRLERKFDEDWAVVPDRLAQLLTPRTRAVILSNLHNPSGAGIDRKTLLEITGLADRVGAMVLVDEVYLDYCFDAGTDPAYSSACLAAPNTISWSSSTKAFGFSATRSGWIVTGDADAARAIRAAADYLHVFVPVATAQLGTRVLREASSLRAHADATATAGRRVVDQWLQTETRVAWVGPTAGITGFVKLPSFMQDVPFCEHLRNRYDTQVVPGSMFEAPGFFRLSYGIDPEKVHVGLTNISSALDDLG